MICDSRLWTVKQQYWNQLHFCGLLFFSLLAIWLLACRVKRRPIQYKCVNLEGCYTWFFLFFDLMEQRTMCKEEGKRPLSLTGMGLLTHYQTRMVDGPTIQLAHLTHPWSGPCQNGCGPQMPFSLEKRLWVPLLYIIAFPALLSTWAFLLLMSSDSRSLPV